MDYEDKNKFINISHEFKAPVGNLSLLLETLYEYNATLSYLLKIELLEMSLKETKRLKKLIDYFLNSGIATISSVNSDKLEKFPFFLNGLQTSYDLLFFYKNCFACHYIYGGQYSGLVHVDKDLYCHIMLNLLENSAKYTSKRSWILSESDVLSSLSLLSFTYDNYARSSVTDGGVGFTDVIRDGLLMHIKKDEPLILQSRRLGLNIVKQMLYSNGVFLMGISYPLRGAKLFFTVLFF